MDMGEDESGAEREITKKRRKVLQCLFFSLTLPTENATDMTTMTLQIPNSQVGWFEQMVRTMGWRMTKQTTSQSTVTPKRVYEKEVNELLSMFKTNQISQEEIDDECELVREEIYNATQEN